MTTLQTPGNFVKSLRDIQTTISADATTLTLDFANGEKLTINTLMLDDSIRRQATCHGLKQKLVDAAALSRDTVTGGTASIEDKFQAVYDVFQRITDTVSPAWNKPRGDGSGQSNGGILLRALVRLYPTKTVDSLRDYLNGKTKQEQAAMRASKRVAAEIEKIKSETIKTTGIDTDALLAELDD